MQTDCAPLSDSSGATDFPQHRCETYLLSSRTVNLDPMEIKPHPSTGSVSPLNLEQFAGILLQDQRTNLFPNRDLFKISHPAVGRNPRIIRSEQNFVLQKGIGILD